MNTTNEFTPVMIEKHEFDSGDLLTLRLADGTFSDIGYIRYLEISYGEKTADEISESGYAYYATNTEYFPVTELNAAREAFKIRLESGKPHLGNGLGMKLEEIADLQFTHRQLEPIKVKELPPLHPNVNPYIFDSVRQGVKLSGNWEAMFQQDLKCSHDQSELILVNTKTGRCFKLDMTNAAMPFPYPELPEIKK